ncbi:hypothetical protein CERZMDRAFT_94784 [Cercospora zeae-maydis SCOH1-5]|uniref:Lysine-specific metallo-endopeptidase domain-containing protein n=1 Tax=Cercospora zeae-maydis SCOH1-5 TaxID=717836 RepID=A0A6A6FPV0_9PEZI|nr:hypothetical protein CERZMDRAFT_94784 [Cercospora zeae-maydis SCOH1-5]
MRVSLGMTALVASATTVLGSTAPSPFSALAASESSESSLPLLPVLAAKEPGQTGHLISKSYVGDVAIEDKRRIVGCDADQFNTVSDALRLVQERLRYLLQKHDREISQPDSDSRRLLELFFGKDINGDQIAFITDKLQRVITEAWQPLYHCQEQCAENLAARYEWQVINGTRYKDIFFCPIFFDSQKQFGIEKGRWVQALYAIHEGIHSLVVPESPNDIGDTPLYFGHTAVESPAAEPSGKPQIAYGDDKAEQLAAYSSEAAMFNADNYRAYVEALHKADDLGQVQESDPDVDYGRPPLWTTIWKGHMRTSTTAPSAPPPTTQTNEVQPTAAKMLTTSQATTNTPMTTAAAIEHENTTRIPNWEVEFVGDAASSSDTVSTVREHLQNWWYGYGVAGVAGFMFVVM